MNLDIPFCGKNNIVHDIFGYHAYKITPFSSSPNVYNCEILVLYLYSFLYDVTWGF